MFICFLYACTDELHQLFIAGRSAEIKDVLIDSFGSLTSILLCNFIYLKSNIKKLIQKDNINPVSYM